MPSPADLESTTLAQRLALLSLVDLGRGDGTPANALEIRDCCGDHVDEVATEVLGTPTEVDVARALNELATTGVLSETKRDPSATGKGRPVYELAVEEDAVLDALAADDRVEAVVERVRESGH